MKTIGNSVRLYDRVLVFTGDGPAGLPPDDPSGQTPRNQRSVHRDEGLLRDPSASPLWPRPLTPLTSALHQEDSVVLCFYFNVFSGF